MTTASLGENSLTTFAELRSTAPSYRTALDECRKMLEEHYSYERAIQDSPTSISVATWVTHRTEGLKVNWLNLALMFVGVLSFYERIGLHPVRTFHGSKTDGQTLRNIGAGLLEAFGLLLLLAGLCAMIGGVACLFFAAPLPILYILVAIVVGALAVAAARFILLSAKMVKLPSGFTRDPTSPYHLLSLKAIEPRQFQTMPSR